MSNDLNLLQVGKIVVLGGPIVWIKDNRNDLILRITENLINDDKVKNLLKEGFGTIREATLKEKEYWFLCHDNENVDFGICSIESFNKWINNES